MFSRILGFIALFSMVCTVAEASTGNLQWETNYDAALKKAKESSKPILLFFTGSDWCGWCTKLDKEVLQTNEFASLVGSSMIFVLIDFPLNKPLDPKLSEQNKALQKKYDVKGFPTIVLLTADEKVIGTTGYRPGGPKSYAEHLLKMLSDFQSYKNKLSRSGSPTTSCEEIQALYQSALDRSDEASCATLLSLGLQKRDSKGRAPLFFCSLS